MAACPNCQKYQKRWISAKIAQCKRCGTFYSPRSGRVVKVNNEGKKDVTP
jgi:ribosomal protein L37AE/L43A